MIFTKIAGILLCVAGIFNARRKINELEKWHGFGVGLAISLAGDILLVTLGIVFILVN